MKFALNEKFQIDSNVEPFKSEGIRVGCYGAPGSGKSYEVGACFIESFLAQGGTVVIFEPRAEWETLRDKFEIVVAGGPFQDIPLSTRHPKLYAEAIIKNGLSTIFNTGEVEEEEQLVNFAERFILHLLKLEETVRRPILLVLEESQTYCPLSSKGHICPPWTYNRMTRQFKECFSQGRKLGINPIAISQRPQELNFTIRMLANVSLYGKFSPQDIEYIDRECLKPYRERGLKLHANQLLDLPKGKWLLISGSSASIETITQKRICKHFADTPKLEYIPPLSSKVQLTVSELAKTLTEALKKEELEESALEKEKRKTKNLEGEIESLGKEVDRLRTALEVAGKIRIEPAQKETPPPEPLEDKVKPFLQSLKIELIETFDKEVEHFIGAPKVVAQPQRSELKSMYEVWAPKLPSVAAKRILKLLVDNAGVKLTKSEIAVKLGYKASGGTFTGALSTLKRNSLVKFDGQLYWCE